VLASVVQGGGDTATQVKLVTVSRSCKT